MRLNVYPTPMIDQYVKLAAADLSADLQQRNLIVVVDDDAVSVDIISRTLRSCWSGDVITFVDAAAALETIRARHAAIALIVLDMAMPSVNGCQLASAIRRSDGLSDVPIAILTAVPLQDVTIRARDAGANYVASKPFNRQKLLAVLQDAVSMSAWVISG